MKDDLILGIILIIFNLIGVIINIIQCKYGYILLQILFIIYGIYLIIEYKNFYKKMKKEFEEMNLKYGRDNNK